MLSRNPFKPAGAPASPSPSTATATTSAIPLAGTNASQRLPLRHWALELARRWNSDAYSLMVLHGNVFDLFPIQDQADLSFVSLKAFLARRFFPDRNFLLFYDIGDGLTFATPDMQTRFFEWLEIYDQVEKTNYHKQGPPKDFLRLAPILRRFFLRNKEENSARKGVTLLIDFPEKIIPASPESGATQDERTALVTLLKWAASSEMRRMDVGVLLITESSAELQSDLLQNPHVALIKIELPDQEDRLRFLQSDTVRKIAGGKEIEACSDFAALDLSQQLSGLNLLRIQQLLSETIRNTGRLGLEQLTSAKKRLIEEYCQGLVRFKNPKPDLTLDRVATHAAAKQKLRELAWLIVNGKRDVLERGVLLPGRVGVGKSFLVDCFASECALPVMEIGDFRSKWVGDTEIQQNRILMTIRALGPVIVVVDEADAIFGNRQADGDSGVSSRVFAAFAAHIGDSSLRGRELWVAMTSRPDLLAIDMKRQGRFGLCIPLFAAQSPEEVLELFRTVAQLRKIPLTEPMMAYIGNHLGTHPLTGSDVESILVRTRERAVLARRDEEVQLGDLEEAVTSFIDPLDPDLLAMQELAAVLACSDRRYLPERFRQADRAALAERFAELKHKTALR